MWVDHKHIDELTEQLRNIDMQWVDMSIIKKVTKPKKKYDYWEYHKKTAHQMNIEAQRRRELTEDF